jgi:hypothetical protein
MMFTVLCTVGGVVLGYFIGAYRQKLLNVKSKVESAVKEEFSH